MADQYRKGDIMWGISESDDGEDRRIEAPWSARDYALWVTCEVVAAMADGLPPNENLPRTATRFALQLGEDESVIATCPYTLSANVAPNPDGEYMTTHAYGLGPIDLLRKAGAAAANAHRRAQARTDMIPRWTPIDVGNLYVTTHGFYLENANGVSPWRWGNVDAAELLGTPKDRLAAGAIDLSLDSSEGPCRYRFRCDYAELLFAVWALTEHPAAPQLVDGSWLPYDWLRRAHRAGYPTRLSRYEIGIAS